MAIIKITELPTATTPLTGDELTPIVQNGVTVKTAISNIGIAGAYINVKTFGATGDGTTDDTAAIQSAIDFANSAGGGTVFFPAGTYYVSQLQYFPGIAFVGVGPASKLLKIPSSNKFLRMFTRLTTIPVSSFDSLPVSWSNLLLDGNSANAPIPYNNYELEQQHLIFLVGNFNGAGRLRAFINNCVFQNGTADAVSTYDNVNLEISDCYMVSCFRGGLVITGGYSYIKGTNLHMSGPTDLTRVDIETDGPGFGGTLAADVQLTNVYSENGFDISTNDQGTVQLVNCRSDSTKGTTTLSGDGNYRLTNCDIMFTVADGFANRLALIGDVTFNDCRLTFARPASAVGVKDFGLIVTFSVPPAKSAVKFVNTDFILDSSVQVGDTANAIVVPNNYKVDGNELIVDGCRFIGGWDQGVYNRGGITLVRDSYIDAVLIINQDSPLGGGGWNITIDNVTGGPSSTTWLNVVSGDVVNGIFRHKNNLVPTTYSAITTDFGLASIYYGGRVIQGASAPTTATNGLPGDRYILDTPVAGSVYEYVCTGGALGATVWKAATTLAA
jgi:hypothetical protein